MKLHIDVDTESGLAHTAFGASVDVNEEPLAHALVHAEEASVSADCFRFSRCRLSLALSRADDCCSHCNYSVGPYQLF